MTFCADLVCRVKRAWLQPLEPVMSADLAISSAKIMASLAGKLHAAGVIPVSEFVMWLRSLPANADFSDTEVAMITGIAKKPLNNPSIMAHWCC